MIQVRRLEQHDVDAAAAILFDAFGAVYRQRGHSPPFPNLESAAWLCRAYLDLDPEGCALAEMNGSSVGVGFVHPRGGAASARPVGGRSVDTGAGNAAGGRRDRLGDPAHRRVDLD